MNTSSSQLKTLGLLGLLLAMAVSHVGCGVYWEAYPYDEYEEYEEIVVVETDYYFSANQDLWFELRFRGQVIDNHDVELELLTANGKQVNRHFPWGGGCTYSAAYHYGINESVLSIYCENTRTGWYDFSIRNNSCFGVSGTMLISNVDYSGYDVVETLSQDSLLLSCMQSLVIKALLN